MTIDKTKLQICVVCNQTIQPKYLGKDKDNNDGRCCDPCNGIVVADRIASVRIAQWEMKQ